MDSATHGKNSDKQKSEKKPNITKPSLNMGELRELVDLIEKRGFTDFEFENEKIRVRISKRVVQPVSQPSSSNVPIDVSVEPVVSKTDTKAFSDEKVGSSAGVDDELHKITSPIVGTFYRSPAPDKAPYVKEGDRVSPDSIVCIVEAMKLMNEIHAEISGEIVEIYLDNGQPVEYGQTLFSIRK